jgi:hypothetical protein
VKKLFFCHHGGSSLEPSIRVDLCLKLLVPLRQPRAIVAPHTRHARSRARVSAVPSPQKKARCLLAIFYSHM